MKSFKIKKGYIILIVVVTIIIIIRLLLPVIVLNKVNKALANMKGYNGHVDDISLAILRGAYVIKGMEIKRDSNAKKPIRLLKIGNIDLSVEWKPIFHGHLAGKAQFNEATVIFTKIAVPADSIIQDTVTFNALLKKMMPLKLNSFEINNGTLKYEDNTSKPKVDIYMTNLHLLALNLSNVYDSVNLLPATISAQANVYDGFLNFNMKLNPVASNPTFDLNAELKNTNLPLLNDFLKAYGNFTVDKGDFSLYTEMAAKEGQFAGYVKPVIKDLKVLGPQIKNENFLNKMWEGFVGTVASVFTNKKKDQLATKIPIKGSFRHPKTRTMYAVIEVLRNAFIQALMPSIDREINISTVDEKNKDQLHKMAAGDKNKESKKEIRREKKKEKEQAK